MTVVGLDGYGAASFFAHSVVAGNLNAASGSCVICRFAALWRARCARARLREVVSNGRSFAGLFMGRERLCSVRVCGSRNKVSDRVDFSRGRGVLLDTCWVSIVSDGNGFDF